MVQEVSHKNIGARTLGLQANMSRTRFSAGLEGRVYVPCFRVCLLPISVKAKAKGIPPNSPCAGIRNRRLSSAISSIVVSRKRA